MLQFSARNRVLVGMTSTGTNGKDALQLGRFNRLCPPIKLGLAEIDGVFGRHRLQGGASMELRQ
jgi:hypothetical protein